MQVIITGCPKSGTMYIATVLSKLGLNFKHEEFARDGCADWRLAPGYLAEPWDGDTHLYNFKDPLILHQVREPLSNMSSCQKIDENAWKYICRYIPLSMEDSLIRRCMGVYYYWNKLADKISVWRYRIEDLDDIFDEFCERIGHPELSSKKDVLKEVPKNINTAKPYRELTWKDLEREDEELAEKVMKLAEEYGYEI
ncbi:hypothetical protein J7L13_02955 [bacterium]|nr:hypothetical protein [bacterium]